MATVSVLPSRKLIYCDLIVTDKSGSADPSANTTVIEWEVVIRKGSVSWNTSWSGWGTKIYATIDITGLGSKTIYIPEYNYGGNVPPGTVVASGSYSIGHNNDGTKSIDFGISFTDNANGNNDGSYYTPGSGSRVGSSMSLQTVPRYATVSTSKSNITETSIDISWTSDVPVSVAQYRLNNGSWVNAELDINKSSGSYTITGLSADTEYFIEFDYKRKDSGLWSYAAGYTNSFTISTYNYPYLKSANSFKIGSNVVLDVYNPLNRSIVYYIIGADNNVICTSGTKTNNGSISIGHSASEITAQYRSIPNSKSGSYKVRMVVSSPSRDTTVNGSTYSIKDDGTENPNFTSSNIINVVDTLHTDITGDNTKFISGHNTLTGVITPMTSSYYANLDYYSIGATGVATQTKSYSTSNISFTINNVTSSQIKVNAVDKRTLSKEATKNITIIPYSKPTLTNNVITRQDGVGDHIYLKLSGKYTNWSGLSKTNGIQTFKYRSKAQGTSTWGEWKTITGFVNSSGTWSINKLLDDTFVNTQRYDMQVQVTDLLETVTFSGLLVSTANALMWKDLQNKRVGVGKKPDFTFDVDGDGNVTALYINGTKMIWYE